MEYFAIGAIFKNESHILKEWIEHYLLRGISHIYLINDKSTDEYMPVLQEYINRQVVTIFHTDGLDEGVNRQEHFYNLFFKKHLYKTTWFGIFDLDEFLYSPSEVNISTLLKNYEKFNQLRIPWVHFGSSGHITQPLLVVPNFLHRGSYHSMKNGPDGRYNSYKSIVKSSECISLKVHEHQTETESKLIIEDEGLLINHYAIQSLTFWTNIKQVRGDVNRYYESQNWQRDTLLFQQMDNNEIFDNRLLMQNLLHKNTFQCVISLGVRCYSAIFLKLLGVRRFSGIFDAAFMRSMDNIIYLLENGIRQEELLYLQIPGKDIRTIHKKFNNGLLSEDEEKEWDLAMLPHHNLQNKNEWEHFQRCMKRFEIIKRQKISTLFVIVSHPACINDYNPSLEDIKTLANYLKPNFNCHVLLLSFEKKNDAPWTITHQTDDYTIINIDDNSQGFLENEQALREIFSFFKVDGSNLLSRDYFI